MSNTKSNENSTAISKSKSLIQLFLVVLFLGMGVSFYSLWHHTAINSNSLLEGSFCNVSDYINCDAVALSSWSEIFGYPVAALALVFYAGLMFTAFGIFFLSKEDGHRWGSLRANLFSLTTIGLVPTFFFAGISLFSLNLLCLMCIFTYIVNLILWAIALTLNKGNKESFISNILPPKKSMAPYFALCAIFAISPMVMTGLVGAKGLDKSTLKTVLYQHFTGKVQNIKTDGFPSLGNKDAKITVVEYFDFQCPYCAKSATVIPQLILGNANNVRLVSKNYPLDPTCNTGIPGRGHPHACKAAKAATCVFKLKGNEAYYSLEKNLFANQASLSAGVIEKYALQEGLSKKDFTNCLNDPATHNAIVEQVEEGVAVGVTGTPAIFVNGRKLEYGASAEVLKATLDKYLESSN